MAINNFVSFRPVLTRSLIQCLACEWTAVDALTLRLSTWFRLQGIQTCLLSVCGLQISFHSFFLFVRCSDSTGISLDGSF